MGRLAGHAVADGEMIPAPEGTHSLTGEMDGVSIVVDAEGIITEIIDTREEAQSAADQGDEQPDYTEYFAAFGYCLSGAG